MPRANRYWLSGHVSSPRKWSPCFASQNSGSDEAHILSEPRQAYGFESGMENITLRPDNMAHWNESHESTKG
jgi:hypothetical protein